MPYWDKPPDMVYSKKGNLINLILKNTLWFDLPIKSTPLWSSDLFIGHTWSGDRLVEGVLYVNNKGWSFVLRGAKMWMMRGMHGSMITLSILKPSIKKI